MVMMYVPAGEFDMGSDDDDVDYAVRLCSESRSDCEREWFGDEQPAHTVALDGFWIDRTEVTNGQYRQCVDAGTCDPPAASSSSTRDSYYGDSAYDGYPVIWVTWHQAAAYCEWAGARLPTEAEWEYAARGSDRRMYPWGNAAPDCAKANYLGKDGGCVGDTTAVGSYPAGASWCNTLDMAGNVWEWVADWYEIGYYGRSPSRNPMGPSSGEYRVLRGGSRYDAAYIVRSAHRYGYLPDNANNDVGFRCARGSE
jgi:formylglycine-generating enzyme required for sulfatase activity